jgi:DNA-binding transcriptional MocR family regulator
MTLSWTPTLASADGNLSQSILDELASAIRSGRLSAGTQLPTQREMADRLGVSLGTVTRAYNLAREQGLLSATTGRGTFVASTEHLVGSGAVVDLSQNFFLRESLDPGIRTLLGRIGDVPPMVACLDVYQPPEGVARHRETVAKWLSRSDWKVGAEQVVITGGAHHAMFVLFLSVAARGETVLAETESYTGIKTIAAALGLNLHGVEMDGQGLLPDALERACKKTKARLLYAVPTLQNPTGAVMSVARRKEIAAVARRCRLTIVEDNVYGFLVENEPPPLANFLPDSTYFVDSLSKSLAPGLRVGFIVAPRTAVARVAATLRATMVEAPAVAAELGCRWIGDGTAARVIGWKRQETRARMEEARAILAGFTVEPKHCCAHLWVQVPENWRAAALAARLQSHGVVISPAEAFAVDPAKAPNAIRICIGAEPSRERLYGALRRIAETARDAPLHSMVVT